MFNNRTNIYDLGYIYFSVGKGFEEFMNRKVDNFFSKSYFLGVCIFLIKFCYFLFHSPLSFKKELKSGKGYLVYGESVNNKNTLLPIVRQITGGKVIPILSQDSYPNWRVYWYALPHLLELCLEIKEADKDHRSTIRRFFPKFWRMYGYQRLVSEMLDYYKPSVVVMANDHLPMNRNLMHEANKRGIPTVYVQHAAVTEKFPPLQFTYSLLDGEDSFRKYDAKEGNSGQIYLTGGIRFDVIKDFPKKKLEKVTVGVAINLVDSEKKVKEVCEGIKKYLRERGTVVLRPHPQMDLEYWEKWCEEYGMGFSNAKDESSFAFISRISVLLANQSSIHLDAAMCRTPSVVYGMSESEQEDNYAFVKNGMVPRVDNEESLFKLLDGINSYKYDDKVVKYYNCSYKSEYEQHVSEMMADLLVHISENNVKEFNEKYGFEKIDSSELRSVYRAS